MGLDDVRNGGEPEPRPLDAEARGLLASEEPAENLTPLARWNPKTVILNGDRHAVGTVLHRYPEGLPLHRVLDGVVEKVPQRARERWRIRPHFHRGGRVDVDLDREAGRLDLLFEFGDHTR